MTVQSYYIPENVPFLIIKPCAVVYSRRPHMTVVCVRKYTPKCKACHTRLCIKM